MAYKIVVIGASAGGIETLRILVGQLAGTLDAALFVTLHIAPDAPSLLPSILTQAGPFPARHPDQDEPILPGRIYVAPPSSHLILRSDRIHLARGPRENGSRPAIDPMFRSAARVYGNRVIGILLSGTLDDGTAGFGMIKAAGGTTIALNPEDSLFGQMAQNAIDVGVVDHVAPLMGMGALIKRLTRAPPESMAQRNQKPVEETKRIRKGRSTQEEADMADTIHQVTASDNPPQEATDFTCPDCGGVLRVVVGDSNVTHYRCHVGHAWSTDSLRAAQVEKVEESLWVALRTLDENRKLIRRLFDETSSRHLTALADHYERRLRYVDYHAGQIRELLTQQFTEHAETHEEPTKNIS